MPTKSDLVERLAKRFPQLVHRDCRFVVDSILDAATEALSTGKRIEIRGFGSFDVGYRKPRKGRNPATGQSVEVPGKSVVRFKAGKEMKEGVNTLSTP